MASFFRHLLHVLGIVLDLIGIGGVTQNLAQWREWLAWTGEWYGYIPLLVIGNLSVLWVWSYWIASSLVKARGGASGKEYPAHFKNWDKVENLTVWQIAWLWNDLEPQSGASEGTPAYSTFRWLKEILTKGLIPRTKKQNKTWVWTTINREKLIAFANTTSERPKFLFPIERYPRLIRWLVALFRCERKG